MVAACATTAWPTVQAQSTLPAEVHLALKQAKVDPDSLVAVVQDVGSGRSRLSRGANTPVNPASLEKLITTQAALELLGPAWAWATPVWLDGTIEGDALRGNVVIKGTGDPKFVAERIGLLMQRIRQLGVRVIRGDVLIDQSAFDIADVAPGQFDNEPLRPYNARPAPLLLNQKSVLYTFTPQPQRGIASVAALPALQGVATDASVALSAESCQDWRARLGAVWDDPSRVQFKGSYPASCGERIWPAAYVDPASYHARVIQAAWVGLGGVLEGQVIESRSSLSPKTPPTFEFASPPLAEVVRDINKYSNNTMAQQLFLTLALQKKGLGTWQGARDTINPWLLDSVKVPLQGLVMDNGAGLSRDSRLTANLLARVLQHAWRGPTMPDLMASLPATGVDGTLRRSGVGAGRAHLKTGSLRDVYGVAGYVLGESGKRYVVVAIVNHDMAAQARPAIEALVTWVGNDSPSP